MSAVEFNYQDGLMHRLESIYQNVDNATLGALVDRVLARLEVPPHLPAKHSGSRWDEVKLYADHLCRQRHRWLQITPGLS